MATRAVAGARHGADGAEQHGREGPVSLEDSLIDAQHAVMIANPSADAREGIAAFREKRAARFEGR